MTEPARRSLDSWDDGSPAERSPLRHSLDDAAAGSAALPPQSPVPPIPPQPHYAAPAGPVAPPPLPPADEPPASVAPPAEPLDDDLETTGRLWRPPPVPADAAPADISPSDDYSADSDDEATEVIDDAEADSDDDVAGEADEADDSPTVGSLFAAAPAGKDRGSHGLRNALIVVLALAVVAGLAFLGYTKIRALSAGDDIPDYPGPGDAAVQVNIPLGAASKTMAAILVQADVVASNQAFLNAVKADPATYDKIQAGIHNMKTKMSGEQALAALADPKNVVHNQVMIPEGWRVDQVFDRINQVTGISVDDLQAQAADSSSLGLPDWAAGQLPAADPLEGFLFPDTYSYDDNPTAAKLLKPMVTQFNQVVTSLGFAGKAQDEGLTPYQALVLASIIQKEGADPTYAQDIAQVFINRLNKGMPLQSDVTVLYACNMPGSPGCANGYDGNIDSPYNTYKYTGLPPGPIANPGQVALMAAVNPTEGDYLYFVAANGQTFFASTYEQHLQNCIANNVQCGQ